VLNQQLLFLPTYEFKMAYSGTIGGTSFNALKVVEHAFRRCRLPAQAITAEMTSYALESLYSCLSELSSTNTPSWCIEKIVLPMYENQPVVTLPAGTVDVLNVNYRVLQNLSGVNLTFPTYYQEFFTYPTVVNTVGIKWSAAAVPVSFQASDDLLTWEVVGSSSVAASSGDITWTDISGSKAHKYFKVEATSGVLSFTSITLGNMPQEIPLGQLNRDGYVNQSNKVFAGRPSNYYFQRNVSSPVINVWPAPALSSEKAQLVVWRHRQIMDTSNLQQDIEVPHRWLEAIINTLAARVAAETPQVAPEVMAVLEQKSAISLRTAWAGDGDGSPTIIQPSIGCYTR
jgi:hypothetical protein